MKKNVKPSKAQLEKELNSAILIIEKGNDYKAFRFSDIGINIQVCKDFTIMSTNFHQNIWNNVIPTGYSNTYTFLGLICDVANKNKAEIVVKNSKGEVEYHFNKLKAISTLDDSDRALLHIFEMWVYTLNDTPFMIGSGKVEMSNLSASYILWLAKNSVIFNERKEDLTKNDFYNNLIKQIRFLSFDIEDTTLSADKIKEISDFINQEEDTILESICDYLTKDNITIGNTIMLPKLEDVEAESMAMQQDQIEQLYK